MVLRWRTLVHRIDRPRNTQRPASGAAPRGRRIGRRPTDGRLRPSSRADVPARSSESSLAPSPSQAPGRQRAQAPLEARRNRCRPGERQLALPSGLLRQGRGDQGSRPRPLGSLGTLQSVDSLRRRSAAAEAWRTSLVYARNSATYFHSALHLCDAASPARCRPHGGPAASFSVNNSQDQLQVDAIGRDTPYFRHWTHILLEIA